MRSLSFLSHILLATVMTLCALTSCDKFLDIRPKGRVIVTTAADFREMLTQAYAIVPEDRGLATFRSDEVQMDRTISAEDISSFLDIWRWQDDNPDNSTTSFGWRNYYQIIYLANHTLYSSITDGSEADINQLRGEAYLLRAYMHFLLVNLYGAPYTKLADPTASLSVPIKLDNDPDVVPGRSSVAAVYEQVLADINAAEPLLTVDAWPAGKNYRFSRLAVDALRSRVYLYMGRWAESLAAARRQLKLTDVLVDPSQLLPNDYTSPENLLALEQVMTATYHNGCKVHKDFYARYNTDDLRRTAYFSKVTSSNILSKKGGSNTYTCSLRTGEVYLNAAEAAARLTTEPITTARDYLLALLRTRLKANYFATRKAEIEALDRDGLLTAILEERARELAFEGHRWFDLRRTTQPALSRSYLGETFDLKANDVRYTLRIPSEAIAANPRLAESE